MSQEDDLQARQLIDDAVKSCGPSALWSAVDTAINVRLAALPPDERKRIDGSIKRQLSVREPDAPFDVN